MPSDGRQGNRPAYGNPNTGRQGNRQGYQPSGQRQESAPVEKAVYFDNKGNLDARWVDTEAEKVALNLGEGVKAAQLRKFYNEVKTLERMWITRGRTDEAFAELLPQVKILKAKAAYAKARGVASDHFHRWLSEHVNAVNTPKDFAAFLLHFEAVVGFSKVKD